MKWNASFAGMSMALLAPLPLWAQIDPVALVNRARSNILENVHRLPKYTCTQAVHRTRFESSSTLPVADCEQLEKRLPPQSQAWADRYKLDVTISEDREIFSWPGNRLRYDSLEETIGADGMTGAGDFGLSCSAYSPEIRPNTNISALSSSNRENGQRIDTMFRSPRVIIRSRSVRAWKR